MSALGHKRTLAVQNGMSASPPKANMCGATAHVCFGPKADMSASFSCARNWYSLARISQREGAEVPLPERTDAIGRHSITVW